MSTTTAELRERFQAFYEERGHLRVPSHSLIPPADDPSTLFIVAGMQPFKPYFLRTREPPRDRVVSVQTCLRAGGKDTDLDDVGRTERHCSFFEMLGNFSFGDYFKDEAVDYAWEFVTQVMGLEPDRLWATVHEGDPVLALDEDAVAIAAWERVGIPPDRIVRLGKDNFWQAAETGPCGQCSEIFYDRGERYACGDPVCGPGALRSLHGDLQPRLHGVRPAGRATCSSGCRRRTSTPVSGLERTMCVVQGVDSVFDTDGFQVIMDWIAEQSGVAYRDSEVSQRAHRVLADHLRAVTFLVAEGVVPVERGARLHLPAAAPARDPAGAAHRPRPRLPAARRRDRADGRRLSRAEGAGGRDRARRARRGVALHRDARARPPGARRARRQRRRSTPTRRSGWRRRSAFRSS